LSGDSSGRASPHAACQNYVAQLDASGSASITAQDVDGGSSDLSGIANLAVNPSAFDCADMASPQVVTLTLTANNGNTASCSAEVRVEDHIAPTVNCLTALQANLLPDGSLPVYSNDILASSSDNCGISHTSIDQPMLDCQDLGIPRTLTLTATDASGNTASCSTPVTAVDTDNPNPICSPVFKNLDANGQVMISPLELDAGSKDNCGIAAMSVSPNTFDCQHLGGNNVLFTVEDASGNANSTVCVVTIEDKTGPIISLNGDNPQKVCQGDAYVEAGATASDLCDGDLTSNIQISGSVDVNTPGSYTITYEVADGSGNMSTETREVIVVALPAQLVEDGCNNPGCAQIFIRVCQYTLSPDYENITQQNPAYQAGATFRWYDANQPNTPLAMQPFVNTDNTGNVFHLVSQVLDGCEGPTQEVRTRVRPSRDLNLDMDLSLGQPNCGGASMDLAASVSGADSRVTGFNFYIGKPNTGGSFLGSVSATNGVPDTYFYHPIPNGNTDFYVQSVMNGNRCGGEATDQTALQAGPTLDPIANITVDHGDPVNIVFTGQNITFVYWFNLPNYLGSPNPNIGIIGTFGSGNLSFTANNTGSSDSTATIRIVPYNRSCSGSSVTINITVRRAGANRQAKKNELLVNAQLHDAYKTAIDWQIKYDQILSHFEIEKEIEENTYVQIGDVGFSGDGMYHFIDPEMHTSQARYRLKLVHPDGRVIYSKAVEVNREGNMPLTFSLFPNEVV